MYDRRYLFYNELSVSEKCIFSELCTSDGLRWYCCLGGGCGERRAYDGEGERGLEERKGTGRGREREGEGESWKPDLDLVE